MPDFTRNPRGTQVAGATPRDFLRAPPEKSGQKMSDGADVNPNDRAPGPPTAAEAANAPPQRPGGVGSVGNPAKPFTLGGGGGE